MRTFPRIAAVAGLAVLTARIASAAPENARSHGSDKPMPVSEIFAEGMISTGDYESREEHT